MCFEEEAEKPNNRMDILFLLLLLKQRMCCFFLSFFDSVTSISNMNNEHNKKISVYADIKCTSVCVCLYNKVCLEVRKAAVWCGALCFVDSACSINVRPQSGMAVVPITFIQSALFCFS